MAFDPVGVDHLFRAGARRALSPAGMIGLVFGGLIFGPYGLGVLPEGSLEALGGIGLLFLMFLAGAELDLNLFQRYRSAAIGFGLMTFCYHSGSAWAAAWGCWCWQLFQL